MPVSGLSRDAMQLCRNWMAPFAEVAGLFGVPKLRELARVNAEDEHNIQTHTDYLTMLVSIFSLLACLLLQSNNKRLPLLGRRFAKQFFCNFTCRCYFNVSLTQPFSFFPFQECASKSEVISHFPTPPSSTERQNTLKS